MKRLTKSILYAALLAIGTTACYDDEGNYDYTPVGEITVENLPKSLTVIQKTDEVVLTPTFKSTTEGVIDENPNFEFNCMFYIDRGSFKDGKRFIDINPEHKKDIHYIPDVDEGDYTCWYTVRDKRTDVITNFRVPVKVTSATYEGWMVLCDVGEENKARLDLVAVLGQGRISAIHDVMGRNAPDMLDAKCIYYDPWHKYAKGDGIWVATGSGTYSLQHWDLKTDNKNNVMESQFLAAPQDDQIETVNGIFRTANFAVTKKGDIYRKNSYLYGAAFELPINTFTAEGPIDFHAAPFIGVSQKRPTSYEGLDDVALFYDKDNKRFIKWSLVSVQKGAACEVIPDPEQGKLFSFTTGKDMIAMENTKFNGGTIYSILTDGANKRSIYGINIDGGAFSQVLYDEPTITDFDKANEFAFHSQYPYMFYSANNKVYTYHLFNKQLGAQPLTLEGEEITMLKFNLWQNNPDDLSNFESEEFMEQQYYLLVGSYKKDAKDNNGGILRMYKFDSSTGTLTKKAEYDGFGKIRDVVYRER